MAVNDAKRIRRWTVLSLAIVAGATLCAQKLPPADGADQETAKLVTLMIPRFHLNAQKIDDRVSSLLVDGFVKDLDPLKLYFLQSDIDEFAKHRGTLDDEVKAGNVEFAYQVFDRFKQRLDRQIGVAQQLLIAEHDFTVQESLETDGKKNSWCQTEAELDERWRKRVKYDLVEARLDGEDLEAVRARLHKRYRNNRLVVDQYSRVEELEIYLTALAQCFDPHSTYMSPQSWEDFEIQMRLSLDGIGAELRGDDGFTIINGIVPGGAAADNGELRVNDKIVGVDKDGNGEIVDIYEMKLSDVVRLIRGPRGTTVRLQVKPADGGENKVVTLTRKKIELKESEVKGELIDTQDRLGRPGRIGLISLPAFYRDFAGAQEGGEFKSAAVDVAKVLAGFAKAEPKVDAVVIDLRMNGGGALAEAIEISGQFIDRGPVVQVREPSGTVESLDDRDPGVTYGGPLVLLCNRLSASASEIFAGVIKDYHRGIIIGDTTTHGKGTVQNLMDVPPQQPFAIFRRLDRGKLKLTIQQFYRVNGDSTQERGVMSDVILPSRVDHWDLGEAFLDNALAFGSVPAAKYSDNRIVTPEIVAALQEKSAQRVAGNEDFQKIQKAIQRDIARKEKTEVSLNEAVLKTERERDEIVKKETATEEELLRDQPKSGDPIFPKQFYNDEVLNVTLDYVAALREARVAADRRPSVPAAKSN